MKALIRIAVWLFLTCQLMTSCVTRQKCEEKFGWKDSDSTIVKDSIVYYHDTLFVPYTDLSFDTASPCPPQVVFYKEVKSGRITGSVGIKDGKISVKCKEDSLVSVIEKQKHYLMQTRYKIQVKTIEKPFVPWYYKAGLWFNLLWLVVIATLIGVIWMRK